MAKYRVTTPVAGYSGEIAGVPFVRGVAELEAPPPLARPDEGATLGRDDRAERDRIGQNLAYRAMAYFRAQGYRVEEIPAEDPGSEQEPGMPKRSASTEVWRTYASSPAGGMTAEEAAALSRDQLAERFLGPKEDQP